MRTSDEWQKGSAGASECCANFERIKCGPVRNDQHDLGTDLFVQIRDEDGVSRGLVLGAQVKSTDQDFPHAVRDVDGAILGWDYYESGPDHFDEWATHVLPHILVLHDLRCRESHWVHVTPERIVSTGVGCKIFVPASQKIDEAHHAELIRVAASRKAWRSPEGSAWTAGAAAVPPGRRLRFAMLAPRLVAPHRNLGFGSPIMPEEALALMVEGRSDDVDHFAKRHRSVPSLDEMSSMRNWRWAFASAAHCWLLEGDHTPLLDSLASAKRRPQRAAAVVMAACALMDRDEHDSGESLLTSALNRMVGVDRAWVLVQRARIRVETGDLVGAKSDANLALKAVLSEKDDVTASVIASAAAWIRFATAEFSGRTLSELIPALDTFVSWWRAQTTSAAVSDLAELRFDAWRDRKVTSIGWRRDTAHNSLLAAAINAHLAGEHGAWRGAIGTLAVHDLVAAYDEADVDRIASAVDDLRRSGDHKSLDGALSRLWQIGPIDALRMVADHVTEASWTHTSASANFVVLARAGDVLRPRDADGRARFCLQVLQGDCEWLARRARPSTLGYVEVLKALRGVLGAAGPSSHRSVARYLGDLDPVIDHVGAMEFERLVGAIDPGMLGTQAVRSIRGACAQQTNIGLNTALLGLLAETGDMAADATLISRARDADLAALGEIGDVRRIGVRGARNVIALTLPRIDRVIDEADHGTHSFGGFDAGGALAVTNVHFPHLAVWEPIFRLLGHDKVAADHKRGVCEVLVATADRVPTSVRRLLLQTLPALDRASRLDAFAFEGPLGGLISLLEAVLGGLTHGALGRRVAHLSMSGPADRMHAVRLAALSRDESLEAVIVGLAGDRDADVRAAAAEAVGSILKKSRRTKPALHAAVVELAGTPGALTALGLARGLRGAQYSLKAALAEPIAQLLAHPSARVRRAAAAI